MAAFRHASQGVTVRNFWLCNEFIGLDSPKIKTIVLKYYNDFALLPVTVLSPPNKKTEYWRETSKLLGIFYVS